MYVLYTSHKYNVSRSQKWYFFPLELQLIQKDMICHVAAQIKTPVP